MAGHEGPTRRERQRQETVREIVTVSRRLLQGGSGTLSISAVAAEMGMTAPALYRYVGSLQGLLLLVAGEILTDVADDIRRARDSQPESEPGLQVIAAGVAFRRWALANRREFGLVFASADGRDAEGRPVPLGKSVVEGQSGPSIPEISAFSEVFAVPFERLWAERRFAVPDEGELDPGTLAALTGAAVQCGLPATFPACPIGVTWFFLRCWARLYGVITLEVFQHVDAAFVASGSLFLDTFDTFAHELAMTEDWAAVRDQVRAELAEMPAGR